MSKHTQPSVDGHEELRSFEPLRVCLAIGALLLGLLAAAH